MISPKYLLSAAGFIWLVASAGVTAGDGVARMSDLQGSASLSSVRQIAFVKGEDCAEECGEKAAADAADAGGKAPCGEAGGGKVPCGEADSGGDATEGCNDADGKGKRERKDRGKGEEGCSDQHGADEGCQDGSEGCADGKARKQRNGLLRRLLGGKNSDGSDAACENGNHGNSGNGGGGLLGRLLHGNNTCPPGSGSIYHPQSPHAIQHGHQGGSSLFAPCPDCQKSGNGYCDQHSACQPSAIQCLFGWAIPSGNCGQGLPVIGKYHTVYAEQPGYVHPADTQVWATGHDGMPVVVPVAPGVNYQYNYSAGMPSSRITPIGNWNPQTTPARMKFQSW